MAENWVYAAKIVAALTQKLGSKDLAWQEFRNLLRAGSIRSIAEKIKQHELTGEILDKFDVFVSKEEWGRKLDIKRTSLGRWGVTSELEYELKPLPGGRFYREYRSFTYGRVSFSFDDLSKIYHLENTTENLRNASNERSLGNSETSGRKRGRGSDTGFAAHDARLFSRIDEILEAGLAQGVSGAALQIADKIAGPGTEQSRAKRLAKRYKEARRPP